MNTALDPASSAGRRIKIVNEFMNPYIRGDDFYAKTTPLNCHSGLDPESSHNLNGRQVISGDSTALGQWGLRSVAVDTGVEKRYKKSRYNRLLDL